ncbi:MAG TPA: hypothetical protein DCM67_07950 [Propionibacteriaceae bacterium]|nr:hypothetical protein [Propionibacteriaceae bacterium]
MRPTFIAGLIATGLLAGSTISPAQAQPLTTSAAALTRQAVTLMKTKRADIDGDGRKDTVRLYKLSASKWRVTVDTAKGKHASKRFTSTIARDWGLKSPWVGPNRMDGRPGAELPFMIQGGDGVVFRVLTWRKGRLINEPRLAGAAWYVGGPLPEFQSYRFYTSASVRYAEVAWLTPNGSDYKTCSADVKRYAWKSSKWVFVRHYTVAAATGVCQRYPGL